VTGPLSSLRAPSLKAGFLAALAAAGLFLAVAELAPIRSAHAQVDRSGEVLTYASPLEMLFSPDGKRLYVLCQGSDQLRVLDSSTHNEVKHIPTGHLPRSLALSPDGARLYIANSWDDTISVLDTSSLEVISTWPASAEPSGVYADRSGKHLFVAKRISNDVTVLNAQTGEEEKRLAAGRGASYITPTPDGTRIYVTHVYPNPAAPRSLPESEITVIDTARATVIDRIPLPGVAHGFHIGFSTDGRLGVAATLHPKNLVPLAHLEHGGAFADTLTLFGPDIGPAPAEIPLDELEGYAVRPFAVAIAPDKSRLYVTNSGSEIVTVIDISKLLRFLRTHKPPYITDLSASANYVVTRIPVGRDPRGLAFTPDGTQLYVANRLEDTLSIIDARTGSISGTIQLQGPRKISVLRHGEQTFYTARYSFQGQIGCANCHIDSTFDGLTWDLEPDGFGRDVVDNRPIEDLKGTQPYKWNGGNPNLPTECGPRTEKYFWRAENYDSLTLTDLVTYVRSLPSRPNRWRSANGELTPAQERGRAIFERATDKFGKPIAEGNRCSSCHSGPKGTSQRSFEVGTRRATDNSGLFDTPQLTNIALTAPYLHDGSAVTLEEIWTKFNPQDKHGRTNDLTKDELNDLIQYLRTR
jgi:YVTN family beta-propeller protein